jgi:hypothetical protein
MTNPIEVQRHLQGAAYPAHTDELVAVAERNDAPGDVIDDLSELGDREFGGPDDVLAALLGQPGEQVPELDEDQVEELDWSVENGNVTYDEP